MRKSVSIERLDVYEEEGLEQLAAQTGKRRKKRTKQIKRDGRRTHKRTSRTDPEAGHLKRPGKPERQHYLAHQAVDTDRGVIVDVAITPGDVNDLVLYLKQFERLHKTIFPVQTAIADVAYDFPLAHRVLHGLGIRLAVRLQKVAVWSKAELKRENFRYDEAENCYVCPQGKRLHRRTLARTASGLSRQSVVNKQDCQQCPLRGKCLSENDRYGARKVSVSYFAAGKQHELERRCSQEYREALKLRQIWCEDTFAAQKRSHNLTGILRRG